MSTIPKLQLSSFYLAVLSYNNEYWLVPLSIQTAIAKGTGGPKNNWPVSIDWVTKTKTPAQDASANTAGSDNKFTIELEGGDDYSAKVTVEMKDSFSTAAADRAGLRSDFSAFRELLDTLEDADNGLAAGAGRQIAENVGETLPVMLKPESTSTGLLYEPLYFRYGLEPFQSDLHPGMRLRVDYGVNQFVPPSESLLNGYTGGAVGHYTVASTNSDRKLTFDTFMSQVGPLNVSRLRVDTIGGVVDLQSASDARRHYRLFYPATVPSSTSRNDSIQANVTLVGADQLKDLTDAYPTVSANDNLVYSKFRGRATVTPEIQVNINDETTYVPVGTTVRQIVEAGTNWGAKQMFRASLNNRLTNNAPSLPYLQSLFVDRHWGVGGLQNVGEEFYNPFSIVFVPNADALTDTSLFDLPVVQGDGIRFQIPAKTP